MAKKSKHTSQKQKTKTILVKIFANFFLIEHELGRRIARMLRRHLNSWKKGVDSREPVARFLKSYAVFISDHTGKEDRFFDIIEEKKSISEEED